MPSAGLTWLLLDVDLSLSPRLQSLGRAWRGPSIC